MNAPFSHNAVVHNIKIFVKVVRWSRDYIMLHIEIKIYILFNGAKNRFYKCAFLVKHSRHFRPMG